MTVTIQNDRDVLLQASTNRSTSTDRAIILSSSAAVFKVTIGGVGSPSSITFTPSLINISGTVVYTATAGIAVTSANNVATLNFSDMTAVSGSVTATVTVDTDVFTKTVTISKVVDGSTGAVGSTGANGTAGANGSDGAIGAAGANGTNGATGARGNVNISAATTGTVWSDAEAAAALASAGYGTPRTKDIVALTNATANFVGTKIYTGSAWTPLAAFFDGALLVNGTVFTDALAANSVVASKISVTSLAAISAIIGTLRTASSGARTEVKDNVIKVFDSGGTVRVQIGDLTL